MEFTTEEKKVCAKLLKEPISLWLLALCFVAASVIYSTLKNYVGWTWLELLHIDLPWVILLVLVTTRNRITSKERGLLQKLVSQNPGLDREVEDQKISEGL